MKRFAVRWLATLLAPTVFATVARAAAVSVREAEDYVFGNYTGEFQSPPSADGNPRKALIVEWADKPYRLVFAHEGSYCPWFEFPPSTGGSGAGACFQFFEGNDGWAELFNQHGRQEKNSFVEVVAQSPAGAHVRWTYFGVNQETGQRAYRATEDFHALSNGLVLRKQRYESLMPADHRGYAREPIELIGLAPVGKLWSDVLRKDGKSGARHALAALDPFSTKRYDVYWTPKPAADVWDSTQERRGCAWKDVDDSAGVVLALPLRDGVPFVVFGDASGFRHDLTRIKDHSFKDTGGIGWGSSSWDHWPIGWLNSQGHVVDATTLTRYPNHFAPAGMDFFAMGNEAAAKGVYHSLCGVAGSGDDLEPVRRLARLWLELGADQLIDPGAVGKLPDVAPTPPDGKAY